MGLEAAPAAAVASEHDAALDVHTLPFEFTVIVRHSLIDVDQFRGHIAVGAVDVVGRQLVLVFEEVRSPGMGGSVRRAVKWVGATSSTDTSRGVGYSTENVSMEASQPHSRNFCNSKSAFALSWAEPT